MIIIAFLASFIPIKSWPKMKQLFFGFSMTGLAVVVLFGLIYRDLSKSNEYLSTWLSAAGRILSAEINRKYLNNVSGSANNGRQEYWVFDVSYEYSVNGRTYIGTHFSNSESPESLAIHWTQPSNTFKQFLVRYPVGMSTNVRYAPDDPQKSYLELDLSSSRIFLYVTIFGVLLFIICLIGWALV
jgi:hypothetical protein